MVAKYSAVPAGYAWPAGVVEVAGMYPAPAPPTTRMGPYCPDCTETTAEPGVGRPTAPRIYLFFIV